MMRSFARPSAAVGAAARLAVALLVAAGSVPAWGHGLSVLGTGEASELAVLFEGTEAFRANLRLVETARFAREPRTSEAAYFYRSGRLRIEWDDARRSYLAEKIVEQRRKAGLSRLVQITNPVDGVEILLYPDRRAFLTRPLDHPLHPGHEVRVERQVEGNAQVGSFACIRNRVKFLHESGPEELLTCNAPGLGHFPVRIEKAERSKVVRVEFTDIRRKPVPMRFFEVPSGYVRLETDPVP